MFVFIFLVVLCVILVKRFRTVGKKGVGKYICGIWASWLLFLFIGGLLYNFVSSTWLLIFGIVLGYSSSFVIGVTALRASAGSMGYWAKKKAQEETSQSIEISKPKKKVNWLLIITSLFTGIACFIEYAAYMFSNTDNIDTEFILTVIYGIYYSNDIGVIVFTILTYIPVLGLIANIILSFLRKYKATTIITKCVVLVLCLTVITAVNEIDDWGSFAGYRMGFYLLFDGLALMLVSHPVFDLLLDKSE